MSILYRLFICSSNKFTACVIQIILEGVDVFAIRSCRNTLIAFNMHFTCYTRSPCFCIRITVFVGTTFVTVVIGKLTAYAKVYKVANIFTAKAALIYNVTAATTVILKVYGHHTKGMIASLARSAHYALAILIVMLTCGIKLFLICSVASKCSTRISYFATLRAGGVNCYLAVIPNVLFSARLSATFLTLVPVIAIIVFVLVNIYIMLTGRNTVLREYMCVGNTVKGIAYLIFHSSTIATGVADLSLCGIYSFALDLITAITLKNRCCVIVIAIPDPIAGIFVLTGSSRIVVIIIVTVLTFVSGVSALATAWINDVDDILMLKLRYGYGVAMTAMTAINRVSLSLACGVYSNLVISMAISRYLLNGIVVAICTAYGNRAVLSTACINCNCVKRMTTCKLYVLLPGLSATNTTNKSISVLGTGCINMTCSHLNVTVKLTSLCGCKSCNGIVGEVVCLECNISVIIGCLDRFKNGLTLLINRNEPNSNIINVLAFIKGVRKRDSYIIIFTELRDIALTVTDSKVINGVVSNLSKLLLVKTCLLAG